MDSQICTEGLGLTHLLSSLLRGVGKGNKIKERSMTGLEQGDAFVWVYLPRKQEKKCDCVIQSCRAQEPCLGENHSPNNVLAQTSHIEYSCPLVGESGTCTEVDLACKEQPQDYFLLSH